MKKFLPILVTAILVGGGAFYGGMEYSKSLQTNVFQRMGQESRVMNGSGMMGGRANMGATGGMTIGEILSVDDQGLTVKIQDGGSKIILFGSDLAINKQTEGEKADLVVGENVSISGETNTDGSITAKSIQIRPVGMLIGSPNNL